MNAVTLEPKSETRADWYARRFGGGLQKARIAHRCDFRDTDGFRCVNIIHAGTQFFNTQARNPYSTHAHAKIKLCNACAAGKIFHSQNYKGKQDE